jgi:hypothetical protein
MGFGSLTGNESRNESILSTNEWQLFGAELYSRQALMRGLGLVQDYFKLHIS